MVYIQAQLKRAQLRQILLVTATAAASPALDALLSFQTSVNEINFQKGRQYTSTSGSGQSASFAMVGSGSNWTQPNVFMMSEEYFDIYFFTLKNNPALVDDGTPPNTKAIFLAMLDDDRLQTVTRRSSDFTLLGFPQVGQLTT